MIRRSDAIEVARDLSVVTTLDPGLPWRRFHWPLEEAERLLVVRDDDAHPVRNITCDGIDGVWVEVACCTDEAIAIAIAMRLGRTP
ncbi:MAG: hypothetical protein FJ100_23495 [Deltaproteobacteria bacterium]|nr:hypothetical protein [Deltaproteobacteria bacterium]